jgi:hypothetical protein
MNDIEEDRYQISDRRSSTTSSVYANSTISTPNVRVIIQSVATIIHSQMLEDISQGREIDPSSDLYSFSEEKYIRQNPEAFDEQRIALLRKAPTVENIFEFIKALYDCAQFSPECCIISLIYINRLIAFSGMPLSHTNWRPIILCALLVSQKVWDDRYLNNSDFAYIYPFFSTEEINNLEHLFLDQLNYSVTVKAALYAKYYFELRSLFADNAANFPIQPLNREKAAELEGRSEWIEKKERMKAISQTCANPKVGPSSQYIIN